MKSPREVPKELMVNPEVKFDYTPSFLYTLLFSWTINIVSLSMLKIEINYEILRS